MADARALFPAESREHERLRLARRARLLSWTSLTWLTFEGSVAVVAGAIAGSIALVGFGLDSAIEGMASIIVIWRFTGSRTLSDRAERRAQKLVGLSFFLLAPYIAAEALHALVIERHPEASPVGAALLVGTFFICPWLGMAKKRVGERLGSVATKGEGRQNLLCAYLAGGVLVGLLGNALAGLWWLDPAVAMIIAAVAIHEGRKAWRGEGCECCAPAFSATEP
jgi:divalent metal cation (Fe/Co/Zn/Cd) transporter